MFQGVLYTHAFTPGVLRAVHLPPLPQGAMLQNKQQLQQDSLVVAESLKELLGSSIIIYIRKTISFDLPEPLPLQLLLEKRLARGAQGSVWQVRLTLKAVEDFNTALQQKYQLPPAQGLAAGLAALKVMHKPADSNTQQAGQGTASGSSSSIEVQPDSAEAEFELIRDLSSEYVTQGYALGSLKLQSSPTPDTHTAATATTIATSSSAPTATEAAAVPPVSSSGSMTVECTVLEFAPMYALPHMLDLHHALLTQERIAAAGTDALGSVLSGFPDDVTAYLALASCSCLAYLHSKELLHRDLKPGEWQHLLRPDM